MNFQKPSEQSFKDTAAMTGGVVGGGMLSKGVFGLLHNPTATTDPTQLKKDQNMAMLKRGGLVVAGFGAAACITGKDTLTTLVKGLAIGIAAAQGMELIGTLAAKSGVTPEAQATTPAAKFLARAAGLGCPCNGVAGLGNPMPRWEMYTETDQYAPAYNAGSFLDHPLYRAVEANGLAA